MNDPYKKCSIFETTHFTIRLIKKSDAEDLLECYSDENAQKYFNADNCLNDFKYKTLEEMNKTIDFWVSAYKNKSFIRFSIVNKSHGKAVGTIEIFGGSHGVLKIDIKSEYEKKKYLNEIIDVSVSNFYVLFKTNRIITKAIPEANDRIMALTDYGFKKYTWKNYFFKDNGTVS
jgi:hypothetical protein